MPKNFNQGLKYRKEGYQCREIPCEVTGVRNYLLEPVQEFFKDFNQGDRL